MAVPLSYSHFSAYKICPRRYEFQFIKKLPQKIEKETAFGISMHSCLAKFGNSEMRKCGNSKINEPQQSLFVEDAFSDSPVLTSDDLLQFWQESFITNGYDSKVVADFDRERGERLLKKFFNWWKEKERKVVSVEGGFKMKIIDEKDRAGLRPANDFRSTMNAIHVASETIEVSGRFDRVEELSDGTLRIIDYKTGHVRSQESIDQDLQFSIYAMAAKEKFKKEVSELIFLFLSDEELIEIRTHRGAGELETARKTMLLLNERISSADFTPIPSSQVCKHCPYRRVCNVSAL